MFQLVTNITVQAISIELKELVIWFIRKIIFIITSFLKSFFKQNIPQLSF